MSHTTTSASEQVIFMKLRSWGYRDAEAYSILSVCEKIADKSILSTEEVFNLVERMLTATERGI